MWAAACSKKKMTNPLSILKRSAVGEGTKVSTAAAEIQRRFKNNSINSDRDKVEDTIMEYMECLIGMGYSEEWRIKLLTSSVKGYIRVLNLVAEGKTRQN